LVEEGKLDQKHPAYALEVAEGRFFLHMEKAAEDKDLHMEYSHNLPLIPWLTIAYRLRNQLEEASAHPALQGRYDSTERDQQLELIRKQIKYAKQSYLLKQRLGFRLIPAS
jgi:hypothetical protein